MSSNPRPRARPENDEDDDDTDVTMSNIILSVYFGGGNLGAAFFDASTNVVYVVNAVVDSPPEFPQLRNLFAQINPQRLVVSNRSALVSVALWVVERIGAGNKELFSFVINGNRLTFWISGLLDHFGL